MVELHPATLRFVDRRIDGLFRVEDHAGRPVAFIDNPLIGNRFCAHAADGAPLCSGRPRRLGFSWFYDLLDGTGRGVGAVRTSLLARRVVVLPDGQELAVRSRWFGAGWALVDAADRVWLWSVRDEDSALSLTELQTGRRAHHTHRIEGYRFTVRRPGPRDEWLVTPSDALTLAQTVAIVEAYRIAVRRARRNRESSG